MRKQSLQAYRSIPVSIFSGICLRVQVFGAICPPLGAIQVNRCRPSPPPPPPLPTSLHKHAKRSLENSANSEANFSEFAPTRIMKARFESMEVVYAQFKF